MASSAVESTLDVACWFLERARREDMYLQPQKLQRLLYITQGFYGAEYYGRKLMPATFVAHELGPVEPTIFRLFEIGRPNLKPLDPPTEVDNFLHVIWRRLGHHPVERLNHLVGQQQGFKAALKKGRGEEIALEVIVKGFIRENKPAETVETADGRKFKKWVPQRVVQPHIK